MPELARVFASPAPISICGQDFILDPLNMADLGAIADELASRRKRGVMAAATEMLAAVADPTDKRTIIKEALAASNVTFEEALQWATATPDGVGYALWFKIESKYPGRLTREKVLEGIIDQAAAASEASRRLLNASGPATKQIFFSLRSGRGGGGGTGRQSWIATYWRLTRPVEAGGHGMSPGDVQRLTPFQLYVLSLSEKDIKQIERSSDFSTLEEYREHRAKLREYYDPEGKNTGKRVDREEAIRLRKLAREAMKQGREIT